MDIKKWRPKRPISLLGLGFLIFSILNPTHLFSSHTYALDDNVSVNINPVLALTVSDSTVNVSITPSDTGTFSSSSFTATVSSNNSTGYKLLLTDYDTDTNLVHAVTSTATIPTLSSNTTKTSFPSNQWGLSLDDTNYLPTPASNGTAITVKEATTPVSNQASTVYAGAKVTNTTMSGAYTDVVTISLIANPTPTSFNQAYALAGKTKSQAVDNHYYYTMQDMNKSICDLTANEQQTTLVDIRDSKTYTIFKSKAPDSKCWMNQNLDLDLSSSTPLTNVNTDLNSVNSWTPERSTIAPGNLSTSTWADDNNNPYSYNPGNIFYYTSGDNTDDTQYNSLDACKVDHTEAECRHYHAGNYYNFSAAVASNDTSASTTQYTQMPNSICPKSWRLPEGPLNASDYSDFNDILATYEVINYGASGDNVYLSNGFYILRTNPLYFVRSGYAYSGGQGAFSSRGYYWSSSISSNVTAFTLSFGVNFVDPPYNYERFHGFSVRCLADNRYNYSLNYNPNGTNVSNLPSKQAARSTNSTYSFTTSSDIPTRTGYSFLGYATSPDGEVIHQPGATVSVSGSSPTTTLYAKWDDSLGFNNSGITTMQEMTSSICSAASRGTAGLLQDTRDNKIYSIFKGNDDKCWMNQNLDIDLFAITTFTNTDTDLNSVTTWTPIRNTIAPNDLSTSTWADNNYSPYSYNPGDIYYFNSGGADYNDIRYNSLAECVAANHAATECNHYHAGNFYNWSAAAASNDTSTLTTQYTHMPNSICPKGWKLSQGPLNASDYSDIHDLLVAHSVIATGAPGNAYLGNGFNDMRANPLYFVRAGWVSGGTYNNSYNSSCGGNYHYSSVDSTSNIHALGFNVGVIYQQASVARSAGSSLRCVAR